MAEKTTISPGDATRELVSHFNEVTGGNAKPGAQYIKTLVNARLAEGYTVGELKEIITGMHKKWHGTKWQDYVRFRTLLCQSKCDGYLTTVRREREEKKLRSVDDLD